MGFKLQSWFRRRRSREEKSTTMVLTVTEDTPADMLTGSMELLVQLPRDHHVHSQRVTVERSTAMMDLLVQIATAHKLAASSYTLQAIGERGLVLPHQPNTPIGALDALQVKLLPKQGTFVPRKAKQPNQPFETTFRLQVHLPRNQLYVSRVSPKMNLREILEEVCREKNLDRNKYELRHPGNHQEVLDLSLSLQDYHLQEVTLYAKQGQILGSALSSQDIMALQRQEDRRRQQAKSVFGFMFRKSKESSVSTDSLGGRSVSPAHSDETARSVSPLAPPTRPQRKRRPAPNPPVKTTMQNNNNDHPKDGNKEKLVISHSRNSSDSSGYHEASVLSDNPDSAARMPETLPRRSKPPGKFEIRKLAHTSQASKSLSNLALTSASLSHATSNTSLSSTGVRKKRAAPPPPLNRPLSSAISTQALERIVDSEESLTSDMGISKPSSDIETSSKANSDIAVGSRTPGDFYHKPETHSAKVTPEDEEKTCQVSDSRKSRISDPLHNVESARIAKRVDESRPIPKPRKVPPKVPERRVNPVESSVSTDKVDSSPERTPTGAVNPEVDTIEEQINPAILTNAREKILQKSEDVSQESQIDGCSPDSSSRVDDQPVPEENTQEDLLEEIYKAEVENETALRVLDDSLRGELDTDPEDSDGNSSSASGRSCTVISTIPKCCHLTSPEISPKIEDAVEKILENNQILATADDKLVEKVERKTNKSRVFRSQSSFGDFNVTRGLERNSRPTNSHPDNFNCAFNPNFTGGILNGSDEENGKSREDGKILKNQTHELEYPAFITHGTNLAGQHSLGLGKPDKDETLSDTDILLQRVSTTLSSVLPSPQDVPSTPNPAEGGKTSPSPRSSPNPISHHDTSDYVSASGEDLVGTDWEYQLPDPPSAFRDSSSPEPGGYDTITLGSVEAFKDPIAIVESSTTPEDIPPVPAKAKPTSPPPKPTQIPQEIHQGEISQDLKKDIISELSTKIENGLMPLKIPEESKKTFNKSSPRLAPVDNTLSNFTITTYSNQKSPNIYEETDSSENVFPNPSDERIVKTFATLSRNRSLYPKEPLPLPSKEPKSRSIEMRGITRAQSVEEIDSPDSESKSKPLKPVERFNMALRHQSDQKSSAVHRSKSYIVLSNTSKYREVQKPTPDAEKMFKSTSYTNLNQEDELQSVQVLKSILPQLESTLPGKSGVSEQKEEPKRCKWAPPAISLGSWSERPSINVQIKHDTDYKFNHNKSKGTTVVSLNSSNDVVNYERPAKTLPKKSFAYDQPRNDNLNFTNNEVEIHSINEKQEVKNLQEKLSNNLEQSRNFSNGKIEENGAPDEDIKIDTRPVNFRKLTQAFGQVNLRSRSKFSPQNRHSDYFDSRQEVKQEPVKSDWPKVKRYTSIVGINPQGNGLKSDVLRINPGKSGPAPVVKGFKELGNNFTVPPPPTMPVITGVTLKSSKPRPVSTPLYQDPRDQLLESIRNFGREKLRSVSSVS
ncbi:cordon-bleu protein-like 1 isoform X1 [Fopius arisanus]|uniref:Cordon-bleu protein-like 1 isoform X1 n=3 Tax=Braconidae TaxID=7402 RepID=A0A9R1TDC6_9HYME|nr:PREDICTED: cordon-bleu protein-like 1 isoform X1 [Fopius arisanus]